MKIKECDRDFTKIINNKKKDINNQKTMDKKIRRWVCLKNIAAKIIWACEEKHYKQCDVDCCTQTSISFDNECQ